MIIKNFEGALLLLSILPLPISANENWKVTGFQMKLINLLDRYDGYCVDVGSGNNLRFDMPLNAHNCKEGQG